MSMRLVPLVVGDLAVQPATFCPGLSADVAINAPMVMWWMEYQGHRLLFDTGGTAVPRAHAMGHRHYSRTAAQEPLQRLAAIGAAPGDVETVVLSHLHWDHAANWSLFAGATILVQRNEAAYAQSPGPGDWIYFDFRERAAPYVQPDRFTLIDGPWRPWRDVPAVQVIPLPGHTPGSQGLLIAGPRGPILLAGDTVPLRENLAREPPTPNGIATDRLVLAVTLQQLPREWTVFPSHDPGLRKYDGVNVLDERFWKGGTFGWN